MRDIDSSGPGGFSLPGRPCGPHRSQCLHGPDCCRKVIAASTLTLSRTRFHAHALGNYLGGIPPQAMIREAPPTPSLPASCSLPTTSLLSSVCFPSPPSFLPSVLGTHSPPVREGGASPRSCQHLNLPQCELRVGQSGYRGGRRGAKGNSTELRPGGTQSPQQCPDKAGLLPRPRGTCLRPTSTRASPAQGVPPFSYGPWARLEPLRMPVLGPCSLAHGEVPRSTV